MVQKPKPTSSLAEQELQKCEQQFKEFDENVKSLTLDRMNEAPKIETEPLNKVSQQEKLNSKDIYLKPTRSIPSREKFNEDYRKEYEFAVEYVQFEAENREVIGETIELWTKPFAGMPAQEWKVPTNKPVWGPRHLAERIKGCKYHRLTMQQNISTGTDGMGQYYGAMAVDQTVQRLDAHPVNTKVSVFMGSKTF